MANQQIYENIGINRYAAPILATWREATARAGTLESVPFSKEDIVRHGKNLADMGLITEKVAVKNVPDIIYTYRARAELPQEILSHGNYAITGRGKGLYSFSKIPHPNRFRLPQDVAEVPVENRIPQWVLPYMGKDEQGMLTRVAHNDLLQTYLGLRQVFRLQSHLRMGVPMYGQVEVDELYAGETNEGQHIIIGVEAKDASDNDLLNVSQLFGTSMALKSLFPNLTKRLIGVKPDSQERICMCEFAVVESVRDLLPVGQWKAYCLP